MEMNTDPFQNAFPGSLPLRIHHRLRGHFTMEQADDLAGVILEALSQNVATKDDIGKVRDDIAKINADLQAKIAEVNRDLRAEIDKRATDLQAEIAKINADLRAEIDKRATELHVEIKRVEAQINADMTVKLKDLELRLTEKMGKLIFGSTAFTVTVLGALMALAKFI
jgi:uncharacterized small protein (DUF1192 family)